MELTHGLLACLLLCPQACASSTPRSKHPMVHKHLRGQGNWNSLESWSLTSNEPTRNPGTGHRAVSSPLAHGGSQKPIFKAHGPAELPRSGLDVFQVVPIAPQLGTLWSENTSDQPRITYPTGGKECRKHILQKTYLGLFFFFKSDSFLLVMNEISLEHDSFVAMSRYGCFYISRGLHGVWI